MFCPSSADWGNIADWVSGLGALAAVVAAVVIATQQSREAANLRRIAINEEIERKAHVAAEAIRLAAAIQSQAASYAQLMRLGGSDYTQRKAELANEINGLRGQLSALQQFPIADPRLFSEIGRMIHDSRVDASFLNASGSVSEIEMRDLAKAMLARREAMMKQFPTIGHHRIEE